MHASAACAVSVIVPTRNRPERLVRCLDALARQTFPLDRFEVIVVDDGSDRSLEPVVPPFRQRLRLNLVVQANAGPASARNTGAAQASGALLLFTDDDCVPDPDWVSVLHARATAHAGRLIGGYTVNALPQNRYSTASQLLVDYLYDRHKAMARSGDAHARAAPAFFTSNNFAVSAETFRAIGGFNPSFPLAAGEDRELCDRWRAHGYELLHAPDAVVRHAHELSMRKFWRQHLNYGRGAWHLRGARLARQQPPIRIEPLSFYWRLVTYPLRVFRPIEAVPLAGLMGISQVANALGFVTERARYRQSGFRRL